MNASTYDVIVIGSGPGGYVCAIRCAQLGLKTAIVERQPHLGGTCLNVGCIPSKALLHSTELFQQAAHGAAHGLVFEGLRADLGRMLRRKEAVVDQLRKGVHTLVARRGIDIHEGTGSFVAADTVAVRSADGGSRTLKGRHVVVATGSVPAELPFLKPDLFEAAPRIVRAKLGSLPVVTLIGAVTSTEALSFAAVPESLLVIGAGAIGLELGSVWARLGSKVTFIEFLPTIAAGTDEDVSRLAERIFRKQGMVFHTATRVTGCERTGERVAVAAEQQGGSVRFEAEKVLLAVGRKPCTEGLNLGAIGLATDGQGRIPVEGYRTRVAGVWAIGDVIAGPMLAHRAEEDGVAVAEAIASGRPAHADYRRVPAVIYTHPEIASIGLTERAAREAGVAVRTGVFPLLANGRALAQGAADGMAKVVADAASDRLLGAVIIAPGASEMIAAVAAHMEYGGSAEDLAGTIHAHPTIGEALKEAALAAAGRAIHIL